MCEKCDDLNAKIERARHVLRNIFDARAKEQIEWLIGEYEQRLLAIDCKDKQ